MSKNQYRYSKEKKLKREIYVEFFSSTFTSSSKMKLFPIEDMKKKIKE